MRLFGYGDFWEAFFSEFRRRLFISCGLLNDSGKWLAGSLLAIAAANPAYAEEIAIPRIQNSVNVDADLTEPEWQTAKKVELVFDTWPAENSPAPVATTAYVMENGDYFYIAFTARDVNPEAIRAYYRDRDKIWDDDAVGIKIDTYGDHKLAYQFYVNPFGVQADGIANETSKQEDNTKLAWDGIWQSAGKITADGYQVEIAIPLQILNFNDRLPIQQWKIELLRFYPRDLRHRLSNNKLDRTNPCWICQLQPLRGFSGVKEGKHFTLVPSLVAGTDEQRELHPQHNGPWQRQSDVEPGLDIKWGITPDINLNATFNPDFSQVEADEAQVSVNDPFTLLLPEKRSFFLDNADYFSSPLDLVYTRNVNSPDAGAKLTGRHNQHAFAFFAADDTSTQFIVPGNISSSIAQLDQESKNAVWRYRYDATSTLSIGTLGTVREAEDYHNRVQGIDVKYQPNDQDEWVAQWLYSNSQYPQLLAGQLRDESALRVNSETFSSHAGYFSFLRETRHFMWNSRYQTMGEDFRADLGYIPQTDYYKQTHATSYQWFSDSHWWNRVILWSDWDTTHNERHEFLEKELEAELSIWGPHQSFLRFRPMHRDRVGARHDKTTLAITDNTDIFRELLLETEFEVQPWSGVYLGVESETGRKLDFRNNRMGRGLQIAPEVRWNLDEHFLLTTRHTYRTLTADGAEVFTANLTDMRLSYQFSVRSFVRLALIYSDVEHNPENNRIAVKPKKRELGSQLLYSYKVNPQTLIYAGYSDAALSDDEIDDLSLYQRSVFLKLSYAWML